MNHVAAQVTPVILTFNEEPNIERTLSALSWARRVVVVDSSSTDRTLSIARSFPNVELLERPFDTHGRKWAWALQETAIDNFALALDADMAVTAEFLEELESGFLPSGAAAGIFPIDYCVLGEKLKSSLYPPQMRLFRPSDIRIYDRGHAMVFEQITPTQPWNFRAGVLHDDRKDLDRWFRNHISYTTLEEHRILHGPPRKLRDALRRRAIMPFVIGALAWWRAGWIRKGDAALHYALERSIYEAMLALRLCEARMRARLECPEANPQALRQSRLLTDR